jgi:large subunit ribosomal protein L9
VQVVLKEDVESLGLRGDVVSVARGYARNFLLPRGLADPATPGLLRELERRDAQRARHEAQSTGEAGEIKARLEAAELRFDVNAGSTGSLFGSVTATNVSDKLWDELKIRVDRRKLGVGHIKKVGRYTIPVEVFGEVTADLRLLVVPEGGELPPEEELDAAEAEVEEAEAEAAEAEAQAHAEAQALVEAEIAADETEPEAAAEAGEPVAEEAPAAAEDDPGE